MARPLRSATSLIVALFAVSGTAEATTLHGYLDNTAGIVQFRAQHFFPAYTDFLQALGEDPLNPELQMNLGLTLEMSEDYDKAEKAYLSAYQLSPHDPARQFMALFNIAGVRAKKDDIDGALQAYQAALEIEPESLEVKTNIELLWQQQQGKSQQGKKGGKGKDDKNQSKEQNQDNQDKDQNKDQDKKDKDQDKQYQQPKQQPRQFESKDLSKDDVRKILDEIQNQEKSIRAKEFDKGARERRNDKDW